MARSKIVIIGGGFGGLRVARRLSKEAVEVTLVDKTNHHLFQPLLYQVASSALAPRDIAAPIREILRKQKNTTVILDEAVEILPQEKRVRLKSGNDLEFDELVVAVGTRHAYFDHPEWEEHAPGLKTLHDAIRIRQNILATFEQAESADSRKAADDLLAFVVIGAGPTGVELAGAISEIAHKTMLRDFRNINPARTRVFLIEAGDRVLPSYPEELSDQARKDLEEMGVCVKLGCKVTNITVDGVEIGEEFIRTQNVIWAAGNTAPKILHSLGAPLDHQNRVIVQSDLTIPGHDNIFVIGDAAHMKDENGETLPGVAPVAIQQGDYVGDILIKRIAQDSRKPFRYKDRGSMATIGKARAVALIAGYKFKGFFAWLLWSLIHVGVLIGFRNRILVMAEWTFWYLTERRGSRLIYDYTDIDSGPESKNKD